MSNFITKKNRGFTLMEALVAISIIMVAVTSPITIAQKGLSSAVYSKDQMIAAYLAQDAIEYVRNVRDENMLNGRTWLNGINASCFTGCNFDTKLSGSIAAGGNSTQLKYENGFYGLSGTGQDSKFLRTVIMTHQTTGREMDLSGDPLGDELLIKVRVEWSGGNKNYVEVKDLIYNF